MPQKRCLVYDMQKIQYCFPGQKARGPSFLWGRVWADNENLFQYMQWVKIRIESAQKKSEEKFNSITKKRKPEEKIAVDKSTALLL